MLQQYLPFTVLKLVHEFFVVALVVHVDSCNSTYRLRYWNLIIVPLFFTSFFGVATVLTVYGIETHYHLIYIALGAYRCNSTYRLRYWNTPPIKEVKTKALSCNSTYRLRYWNEQKPTFTTFYHVNSCNSTYRLRYWNLPL